MTQPVHPPDYSSAEIQALQAQNEVLSEQLSLALEAGQMCTFVWDPASDLLTLSESATMLWELSPEALPGTGSEFLQFVHPYDRGQYQALLWTARQLGKQYHYEYRLVRPQDGRILWIEEQGRAAIHSLTGTLQVHAVQRNVTERQRINAQLRYHEARINGLLDIEGVGIIFLDPNGVLREANRAFLTLTGYTQVDIEAGRLHWQTLTPPEWMVISLEQMARLAQTGRIGPYEKEYLCRDGGRLWLLFAGTKLRDGTLVEFCIDITERKRAESALRDSEARHHVAVDAAAIGDWTYDVVRGILSFSPRARAMHRLGPEVPLTLNEHDQLIHPEDRAAVQAARAAALNPTGSGYYRIEFRLRFPDEEVRWIESRGHAVMVEQEERRWATQLIGVMIDITERKRTEVALRESGLRFRELAEAVPDIVFTTTAGGVVEYVNPRLEALTGHLPAQVLGTYLWPDLIHPEDLPEVEFARQTAYRAQTPLESRYRLQLKDGNYRWVMARARPIFSEAAEVIRWFGTVSDIDPLIRAETDLRRLNETLEARVAERTHQVEALTATLTLAEQQERQRVSHILHDDLQQLLYGLMIKTHLLQRSAPEVLREQVASLSTHLQRAVNVTRTLVTELNPPILDKDGLPTALSWLADHMAQMYALRVELEVKSFCEPRSRDIRALLIQMVREVLFNVVKHAQTDTARLVVDLAENRVLVRVEDDGIGFDSRGIGQRQNGRGAFGLKSIADRLTLIGGEMTIQARPGQGSCITLRVPCLPAAVPMEWREE